MRLVGWRLALPLLRRTVRTERLVRLMSSPRERRRDAEIERFVTRAASRLWREAPAPCLERSLAVHRQLGLAGADPTLVLGMGRDGERYVGHAWVEVDGATVVDAASRDAYGTVVRFDGAGVPV